MSGLPLDVAPEVAAALAEGRPVVALESTIISHGMPYPANLETAGAVEGEVRQAGAVPATIAIVQGRLRVGLDAPALDRLAGGSGIAKASVRDLAIAVARRQDAATTVAATMRIAALAGIAVFATGGIGGVHRGAADSYDISADLSELALTSLIVVSAGAKSILDIPKTLEYLETHQVPVLGYRTRSFPAFFTRDAGLALEHRADTPREVAEIARAHRALGLPGSLLVANPVPEDEALDPGWIAGVLDAACREAEAGGISGKALTPFLLARVNALSGGRSLAANIALIRSNARLAGAIAAELARAGDRP